MPVNTVSAALHIAPVVVKTFIEHTRRKAKKQAGEKEESRDEIFFDQAFNIVRAFIELGTNSTVESLQAFTNTHVPSPPWAAVAPVVVPLQSCNEAADTLIDWFGPDELKRVVGGERWWQVRGLDGIDAEWITEKEYLADEDILPQDRKLSESEETIFRMEHLETVMLYVHGGGYFWGSINTHRYQIIRFARKFRGRAFAVNYRKAPQYPWPCPLQDVIAAYLYLIHPPEGSPHQPVPHHKIVFAGDSAGGGLCVSVLSVLRDLGLPMPAGAVLISPWVDLTHSFPSIMTNTETDIIPTHGFVAKPSTLWPMDPLPPGKRSRIPTTQTNPPPEPGHPDVLKPSKTRLGKAEQGKDENVSGDKVVSQKEMLHGSDIPLDIPNNSASPTPSSTKKSNVSEDSSEYDIDLWEPKPPKVLMKDSSSVPLELLAQIQMYALTEQLTHPLVSPILQGSLGGLPPLYILAGNDEVLRDEIIYLAHKAAHPSDFPTRNGVLRDGHRQKENAEKFTTPTKVHLQVFDGMCHVLTVFSFTKSATYAYRSIAEFVRHVSGQDAPHLKRNPFPEFHRPPDVQGMTASDTKAPHASRFLPLPQTGKEEGKDVEIYTKNRNLAVQEIEEGAIERVDFPEEGAGDAASSKDIPDVLMIRERVDIHGMARNMEPASEIAALKLRPGEIGIIKEDPVRKWLDGQEEWDKKYRSPAKRVVKRRRKLTTKGNLLLANARSQGLLLSGEYQSKPKLGQGPSKESDKIQDDRRWGPLDLEDERPPPSAIAKRIDTPEAIALLKKSIYHTAPVTHQTVPKLKASDAIRAAFDPKDDPVRPPQQSVSEQQVRTHLIPIHGLRMWDGILRYFGKETSKKAADGTKQLKDGLGL